MKKIIIAILVATIAAPAAAAQAADINRARAQSAAGDRVEREAKSIWRDYRKARRVSWTVKACRTLTDRARCAFTIDVFSKTGRTLASCSGEVFVSRTYRVAVDYRPHQRGCPA